MNFFLVLGLVTAAAVAAPIKDEELIQVSVAHDHTNRDSRDVSLLEPPKHDLPEAHINLESAAANFHGNTSSGLGLESGLNLEGNKTVEEGKKSKALVEDEKERLGVVVSLGKGSDSHVSVAGSASGHEHGADSTNIGLDISGSKGSTYDDNTQGSGGHESNPGGISTQHEVVIGSKRSSDDNPQGSGDGGLGSGKGQLQINDNGFGSTGKFSDSSVSHKGEGSGHVESGESRDELGHGVNNESSLGGSIGGVHSGTVVTSQATESTHESKDISAVSDTPVSENKESKILILGGGSGKVPLTGGCVSETEKTTGSSKGGNGITNSTGISEILGNEHRTSKELDVTLGTDINNGSRENVHGYGSGLVISSGGTGVVSKETADGSGHEHNEHKDNGSESGSKGEIEGNPVHHGGKRLDKGLESDLKNGNVFQKGIELNHGTISTESSGRGVPLETAQNPVVQNGIKIGDLQSSSGLAVELGIENSSGISLKENSKMGHEGTQGSVSSGKHNTEGGNGDSSKNLESQHELTASEVSESSLFPTLLVSTPSALLGKSNSEAGSNSIGGNRSHQDTSLELGAGFSGSARSESIDGKDAENDHKGSIGSIGESKSKSTGGCDASTGEADPQSQQRGHRGFAWLDDDTVAGTRGGENGNTIGGHADSKLSNEPKGNKDVGVNVNNSEESGNAGDGHRSPVHLGAKLEVSVGDESKSKTGKKEKHEHVLATGQGESGVISTELEGSSEGDAGNNKDEHAKHKLSSKSNENKNVEASDGIIKSLGGGHEESKGLSIGLEVGTGGGSGSITEDSALSKVQQSDSLENGHGGSGGLVIPLGCVVGTHESGNHSASLLS